MGSLGQAEGTAAPDHYRPFLLSGQAAQDDWVRQLDLAGARGFCPNGNPAPPK